ncbi:hypothetical protein HYW21_00970 [Candidatus Woesearchaeota archaeon]|nr:hypothetical protein [Candidatus Woesearchaeota archaeon]
MNLEEYGDKEYVKLVQKVFRILFDKYNFKIIYSKGSISSGVCMVILESKKCRVRIFNQRREISVCGCHLDIPFKKIIGKDENTFYYEDLWSDFSLLAAFTSKNTKKEWNYPTPDFRVEELRDLENLMVKTERILFPYWDQIFDFFSKEGYKKREKEFDAFLTRRAKEKWGDSWKKSGKINS